jgi:hypothetical protein
MVATYVLLMAGVPHQRGHAVLLNVVEVDLAVSSITPSS